MLTILNPSLILFVVAVQVIGLVSVWLVRMNEPSDYHSLFRLFYLACLALVGLSVVLSMQFPTGAWLPSGFTLGLMIVGGTCDFQRSARVSSL